MLRCGGQRCPNRAILDKLGDGQVEAPAAPAKRSPSKLGFALAYAKRDSSVFSCWWIDDGRCACGDSDCIKQAGKHPFGKLAPRGVLDATRDPKLIRRWWTQFPKANVAIASGLSGTHSFRY